MVLPAPHAVPIFSPMTRYSFLEESKVTTLHSSVSLYSLIIGASTLGLGVNVALRGEADGEGLLQADIVCCLVLGVILFISYIS